MFYTFDHFYTKTLKLEVSHPDIMQLHGDYLYSSSRNILKNIEVIYVENLQNPEPINFREVEDEVYEVAQTASDLPVSENINIKNHNKTFSDTSEISQMFSSDEEDQIPDFESETPNQSFNGTIVGSTNGSNMM